MDELTDRPRELSATGRVMELLKLSKVHRAGIDLPYFDVIELVGHIESLEEDANLTRGLDVERLADAIANKLYKFGIELTPDYREVIVERNFAYVRLAERNALVKRLVDALEELMFGFGLAGDAKLDALVSEGKAAI